MPQAWPLIAAPLGVSAFLLRTVFRKGGKRKAEEVGKESEGASFSCERVCTSDALLKRLGSLVKARTRPRTPQGSMTRLLTRAAQEATPNTCVTVCGLSSIDACTEACQRAVCSGTHQVPAWNDACLKRCSTECVRRSGREGA